MNRMLILSRPVELQTERLSRPFSTAFVPSTSLKSLVKKIDLILLVLILYNLIWCCFVSSVMWFTWIKLCFLRLVCSEKISLDLYASQSHLSVKVCQMILLIKNYLGICPKKIIYHALIILFPSTTLFRIIFVFRWNWSSLEVLRRHLQHRHNRNNRLHCCLRSVPYFVFSFLVLFLLKFLIRFNVN